jgi:dTDP-glucose pyrophosphorylase
MVLVVGKPILGYILNRVVESSIDEVVLVVGPYVSVNRVYI